MLDGEDLHSAIENMLTSTVSNLVSGHTGERDHMDEESFREATAHLSGTLFTPGSCWTSSARHLLSTEALTEKMTTVLEDNYAKREAQINELMAPLFRDGRVPMRELERVILLRVVDEYWMDHIDAMQELRQGIGLRLMASPTQCGV